MAATGAAAGFGRIERWDDTRGFGFIVPDIAQADAPGRLFVHIRDLDRDGTRPVVGARVRYTPERQPDGRWRAVRVAAVGIAASRTPRRHDARRPAQAGSRLLMLAALVGWVALLAQAVTNARLPWLALVALAGLNLLTFVAYALDKHAARRGGRRTPEAHLHLLELLGGWPAAALAQQVLRHKRAKPDYRRAFAAMIALHLLALAAWTFA